MLCLDACLDLGILDLDHARGPLPSSYCNVRYAMRSVRYAMRNVRYAMRNARDCSTATPSPDPPTSQVLAANPLNHSTLWELGGLCVAEARWKRAAEYFKQACEVAPSHAPYRLALGRARWMQRGAARSERGPGGAFAELLQAVKLEPTLGAAWTLLGHYYAEEAKDVERAKKVGRRNRH